MVRMLAVVIISTVLVGCGKDNAKQSAKPLAPAPHLSEIQPDEVRPPGLAIAQIIGEGLDMKRAVTVYFGTTKSPRAAIVSKTKIQVEIPPGPDGSDVDVRVEIDGQQPTTLLSKLHYREGAEPPPPPGGNEATQP